MSARGCSTGRVDGRGNYYSDNPAFDLNGDGIADTAYRPNDLMDQVIWRAPAAKLLLNSPAVQVVRWAQAQFPAIHPGGVIDTAPLMTPPRPPALSGWSGCDDGAMRHRRKPSVACAASPAAIGGKRTAVRRGSI